MQMVSLQYVFTYVVKQPHFSISNCYIITTKQKSFSVMHLLIRFMLATAGKSFPGKIICKWYLSNMYSLIWLKSPASGISNCYIITTKQKFFSVMHLLIRFMLATAGKSFPGKIICKWFLSNMYSLMCFIGPTASSCVSS